MAFYVGVDIGLDGAISAIDEKQEVRHVYPMPIIKGKRKNYDILRIIAIFRLLKTTAKKLFVVVEKPTPRPVISCTANFMLGGGLYLFEGILTTRGISYQVVTARTWQKDLLKGLNKDTKTASIMFCKRKWPKTDLRKTNKCVKDHSGVADSLCMALYSYRLNR